VTGIVDGMFERFTDRARSVMTLAQEEARLLAHDHIGTEHLLLGLVRQGDGVGGQALLSLGVTLDAARSEVATMVGATPDAPNESPPFTPRAKKVLEYSLREALQLGHQYIGTEHILLGFTREGEGVGVQVLSHLGVEIGAVRQRVLGLMSGNVRGQRGHAIERGEPEPRCPQCRKTLAEGARYRSIVVPPDSDDNDREPIPTVAVYCTGCGYTLHVSRADTD
jgi:ATP-dependent Clp protease ATP-binding subunit ClpC